MFKISFKKIIPLIGIGAISISAISAGVAVSINNNTSSSIVLDNKLFKYSMNNLVDLNILNNPNELANYLKNYGAFGSSNDVDNVEVLSKTSNANNCYDAKLKVNFSNNSSYIIDSVSTSVPVSSDIGEISFNSLEEYFLRFKNLLVTYNAIYSTDDALLNIVLNNTNILREEISRVSINFSNSFNYGNTNTLSFELMIVLNDSYSYNGKNIIVHTLPTSIEINWDEAFNNADTYFNFDDNGTIIGIKEPAFNQEILIIPQTYTTSSGNVVNVKSIKSLIPTSSSSINNNIKAIVLPNQIEIIDDNAFGNSNNLNSFSNLRWINLPKSLSKIGNYAFANCVNLQNLYFNDQEFLVSIGKYSFKNCASMTDIYLNDRVLFIDSFAFQECMNLKIFRISNSLSSLSEGLFQGCRNISYIVIPNSVNIVSDNVFSNASNLKYLNMPYNLKYFGANNFSGNNVIENVVFLNNGSSNQIQFPSNMFQDLSVNKLFNVYITGEYTDKNMFSNTFSNYGSNTMWRIYVTSEKVYNTISSSAGIGYANNVVMIMDLKNPPSIKINNKEQFIEYWQGEFSSIEKINSYVSDFYTPLLNSISKFNVLKNPYWISGSPYISKNYDNKNKIESIDINFSLRSNEKIVINVPLLTTIYES